MKSLSSSASAKPGPTGSRAARGSSWLQALVTFALVTAAVWIVYVRAIDAPFIFDDLATLRGNSSILTLWPLWGAGPEGGPLNPPHYIPTSGRPLVNLTFAMDHEFGGFRSRGYHFFNFILHALAATLLATIVERTLRLPYFGGRFEGVAWPLSLCVALVWAVHPLLTESVIYVTQRTELMMGLFYLATLYAAIRYWTTSVSAAQAAWLAIASLMCLAGMACKEVMVTAPVVVLLYERTFLTGSLRKALYESWPLYAGLACGWLLLLLLNYSGPRADVAGFHHGISAGVWWMTQSRVLFMYLKLAVWPWPLLIHYGEPYVRSLSEGWPWLLMAILLGAATIVLVWRRSAVGFLLACVWLVLSPTLVIPITTEIAAERRMYLPLAALVALAVVGGYSVIVGLWPATERKRALGIVVAMVGLVGVLSMVSVRRLAAYDTEVKLWEDTLVYEPDNPWAHCNLGDSLNNVGRPDEALAHFDRAVELKPDYAQAHSNLGGMLAVKNRIAEAIAHCQEALRLKPDFAEAYGNLGTALLNSGRQDEALAAYKESLRLRPDLHQTQYNMGHALLTMGRPQEAAAYFERAVQLLPESAEAENGWGLALMHLGRPQESLEHFQHALTLKPEFTQARVNIGNAQLRSGQAQAALQQYRDTLRLDPKNVDALTNLGLALMNLDQLVEAEQYLNRALEVMPNNAEAHNNLGITLMKAGRAAEAADHFEAVSRLKPELAEAWANLAGARAQLNQPQQALAAAEKALQTARATGETALAEKIEAWLANFQRNGSASSSGTPANVNVPGPALPPSVP